MVYVSVDDIILKWRSFFIDLTVMGYKPSGCIDAVNFITCVFERMRFKYLDAGFPLYVLGYYIGELSRRKIYLAVVPMDTHNWTPDWSPPDCPVDVERCNFLSELPVCVFVDVGSPLRHLYIAFQDPQHSLEGVREITYWVEGAGVNAHSKESLIVRADFHEGAPTCTAAWCGNYLKTIEDKIYSKDLYVGVYPAPVNKKHRRRLMLVEKALKLAGLHGGLRFI